jgi:hypothetical protein
VPAKANRCPHCWSALADYINDFCPHCQGSLAPKQKRRWGDAAPETKAAIPPPPGPDQPYQPYQPYQPHAAPAAPGITAAPAAPAASAAPAPVATAVAVLERDPVEFPGTPLPSAFFDGLPHKADKQPKHRRFSAKTLGVGGAIALASMGGISGIRQSAERDAAVSSPARDLVAGVCTEYRDFTTDLNGDRNDVDAMRRAVWWFQSNVDRFSQAAAVDPDLAGASEVVAWFDRAIKADFAPIDAMTDAELDAFEQPLVQACYNGPGRA